MLKSPVTTNAAAIEKVKSLDILTRLGCYQPIERALSALYKWVGKVLLSLVVGSQVPSSSTHMVEDNADLQWPIIWSEGKEKTKVNGFSTIVLQQLSLYIVWIHSVKFHFHKKGGGEALQW